MEVYADQTSLQGQESSRFPTNVYIASPLIILDERIFSGIFLIANLVKIVFMLRSRLLFLCLVVLFYGCGGGVAIPAGSGAAGKAAGNAVNAAMEDETEGQEKTGNVTTDRSKDKIWAVDLLSNYINNSENKLIRAALKGNAEEVFLYDDVQTRDDKGFWVYRIGHSLDDKDGKRFVTDGWVYIDTVAKQLYEYDVAEDELKLYKN